MSSVLRVFKFRGYFHSTAKSFFKNPSLLERSLHIHNFKLPIQLGSVKICERTYQFQHSRPEDDFLTSSLASNLDADFKFVDSILGRGSFINKRTLENIIRRTSQAQKITSSQAVFLLNCCRSSATLENKATRRKLATQVWKIYEDNGIQLDISHYNAFLQVLVETEADFSPLDFLATLEEKKIKPNRITYSRLIAKFCQKGDIDGANKILEHLKNNGIEINEYVLSSLILGNSRAKDLEGALQVLDIMKQNKIKLGPDTYAALIQAYAEHGKFDEIDSLLSEIKKELLNDNMLLEIACNLVNQCSTRAIEKVIDCLESKETLPIALLRQAASLLIYSGEDELAYKLYRKLPRTEDQNYIGNFFPKQLASASKNIQTVVKYCDELRNNGFNILSYESALESYLHDFKFDSAMALARVMNQRGIPLKEHYFYPILIDASKNNNRNKLFEIYEELIRFKIHLNAGFYSEYLLPCLKITDNLDDIQSVYMRFLSYRDETDIGYIYNGFIEYMLKKFDLEVAAKFVDQNRRGIMPFLGFHLAEAFLKNCNAKAAAAILVQILPADVRMHRDFNEEEISNKFSGIKSFLRFSVAGLRRSNLFETNMPELLKALEKERCYLLPSIVEDLKLEFGESLTPDIQETLQRLSDPTWVTSSSYSQEGTERYVAVRPSLRQRIAQSEAEGQFDESLNMTLLINCIQRKHFQEAEETFHKLKSNKVDVDPPVYLMYISHFVDTNQFEKAEEELNNFLEKYPDFQISPVKILKFAKMFTDLGRFEDAVKCILINSPENGEWPKDISPNLDLHNYKITLLKILKDVAAKSDLSTLKRIQEALLINKYAPPALVMHSLITYHLHQNNIEEALSSFKRIAEEHRVTAGKFELTTACIEKEDTDRLQQILDISNQIHGDLNTLYDLAFAFIDAGKFVQAERVLQTSGMRTRQEKLDGRCLLYLRTGKVESLKGLISATRNLFNINRHKLYGYLLEAYIQADDPDNSLGVWTLMQEESIIADDEFLARLGNYLLLKGYEVPFVIPQSTVKSGFIYISDLEDAVQKRNLNVVKQLIEKGNPEQDIPLELMNKIIETFLENGMSRNAAELTKELLLKNQFPPQRVMRQLLTKLEEAADVASIEALGKCMDQSKRFAFYYETHLSSSIVKAGKAKELFETNLKLLEENSDDIYHNFSITRKSLFLTLQKHPEMYQDVLNLTEIMRNHENSQIRGLSSGFLEELFQYNFISGNFEESDKIYKEHLENIRNFKVKRITSNCYRNKDIVTLGKLVELLNRNPEGREGMKGFIYSTHIDILNENEEYEEAVNFMKKSLEDVTLENYRRDSLSRLKRKMILKGLNFPFEIPVHKNQVNASSSSSSSSDDEK